MNGCYNMAGRSAGGAVPKFEYTGLYNFKDEGEGNWSIAFLTSGVLTFTNVGNASKGIDVFAVGGGGSGYLGGGGGGYTNTVHNVSVLPRTPYEIVVGAGGDAGGSGGETSAFSVKASGGLPGTRPGDNQGRGGDGGSGGGGWSNGNDSGDGGSDGGDGVTGKSYMGREGGKGQGTTTREFGEPEGALYAGGGGGGNYGTVGGQYGKVGKGGAGGGGDGGDGVKGSDGVENTGGGGGGGVDQASKGGSGIVIIRNHREVAA